MRDDSAASGRAVRSAALASVHGLRRSRALQGIAAVTAAAALAAASATPAVGAGKTPVVSPKQELATLLTSHKMVSSLHAHPARTSTLSASRPVTGGQTVLPVVGHFTTSDGLRLLQVMVPGRPNGGTGWIKQEETALTTTSWHVLVRTSARQVLVYRRGRLVRSFTAIVGKRSTPTPHGAFFVEESVRMPRGSAGAPFALALSARSNVLQEFEGGPGQTAIHGVANLAGRLGTAASHGCVRLAERSIRWLAARITAGVPVTIES